MKAMAWLFGGFVLLGLSGMIEAMGDAGASAADRLPFYLTALVVLLGAPFCFYKAFRAAFAGFGRGKREAPASASASARPAHRIVDPPASAEAEAFDPDAAFARYMEKRAGHSAEAPATTATAQTQRPSFGRRVV